MAHQRTLLLLLSVFFFCGCSGGSDSGSGDDNMFRRHVSIQANPYGHAANKNGEYAVLTGMWEPHYITQYFVPDSAFTGSGKIALNADNQSFHQQTRFENLEIDGSYPDVAINENDITAVISKTWSGISIQVFNIQGDVVGDFFYRLNTAEFSSFQSPQVTVAPSGQFILAWLGHPSLDNALFATDSTVMHMLYLAVDGESAGSLYTHEYPQVNLDGFEMETNADGRVFIFAKSKPVSIHPRRYPDYKVTKNLYLYEYLSNLSYVNSWTILSEDGADTGTLVSSLTLQIDENDTALLGWHAYTLMDTNITEPSPLEADHHSRNYFRIYKDGTENTFPSYDYGHDGYWARNFETCVSLYDGMLFASEVAFWPDANGNTGIAHIEQASAQFAVTEYSLDGAVLDTFIENTYSPQIRLRKCFSVGDRLYTENNGFVAIYK